MAFAEVFIFIIQIKLAIYFLLFLRQWQFLQAILKSKTEEIPPDVLTVGTPVSCFSFGLFSFPALSLVL